MHLRGEKRKKPRGLNKQVALVSAAGSGARGVAFKCLLDDLIRSVAKGKHAQSGKNAREGECAATTGLRVSREISIGAEDETVGCFGAKSSKANNKAKERKGKENPPPAALRTVGSSRQQLASTALTVKHLSEKQQLLSIHTPKSPRPSVRL